MAFFVDLIIVAVILIAVLAGRRKGFVRTFMNLVSGIIAFIAAYLFTPPLASFFYDKIFFHNMANGLKVSLDNLIGTRDPAAVFADSAARTPLTDIFSKFNLSFEDAAAKFSELTSEGASNVTGALAEAVVAPIASAISYVVSFILIFIAAIVLLSILTHVLDLFAKLPVLKSANKLLGALAGLIYGIIIVWVLSIVLRFALPYLSAVNPALFPSTLFEDSFILRLIYSLNAFKGVFLNNSFVSQFVK